MTTVDTKTLDALGLTQKPAAQAANGNSMGSDVFMKLLVTQLQNQNPLKPQDGSEFVAQLAQFSVVTGINDLKDSFSGFSNSMGDYKGLQAANLVGRNVLITSDQGVLKEGESLNGSVTLDASSSQVTVDILNKAGQKIRTINLGYKPAGEVPFSWDGKLDDGVSVAKPGTYTVKVQALQGTGGQMALQPNIEAPVESVTLGGSNGVEVDLGALGKHSLKDILEVL
jgi:flagellar basal-body rod modification protein FlgD